MQAGRSVSAQGRQALCERRGRDTDGSTLPLQRGRERDSLAHVTDVLDRDLGALAAGDRSAFDRVYAAVAPLFERVAARTLRSPADAEDAAQQALLNVFARAHEYDAQRGRAMPWLVAIVANECRTTRQRVRRRREDADPPERPADGPTAEDALAERELASAVMQAIGDLAPEDARTIRAALELEPRPLVAAATFRKRLERAIGRLRTALGVGKGGAL